MPVPLIFDRHIHIEIVESPAGWSDFPFIEMRIVMTKKQKKSLRKILIAAGLMIVGIVMEHLLHLPWFVCLAVYLVAYFIVGGKSLKKAGENILNGQVFDENFLMMLATVGAFILGEYTEGIAVMLFYQVGELFESVAVGKSRQSVAALMDIRPEFANKITEDGVEEIDPEEIRIGDKILIRPGERIPLDAKVLTGHSTADTSALTGESIPRDVLPGDQLISGCVNLTGVLEAEVTKEYGESTVARILDLVENASSKKANVENFITKFARFYTPIVVFLALGVAVIPPIVLKENFAPWVYRALSFLVVSCPCALVISIPLSFFGGIGAASKAGILVKGSNYLELLASTDTMVFDKTGTLTKGSFRVLEQEAFGMSDEELLEYAAAAETFSPHPIAASIKEAYGKDIEEENLENAEEIPGHGASISYKGKMVFAGNAKLMRKENISFEEVKKPGTIVYVAVDGAYAGYLLIADELKEDAKPAIAALRSTGIKKMIMLTGDEETIAGDIAKKVGLDGYRANLLPQDKVSSVEEMLKEKSEKSYLAYVGDGINDAPVLARADVGIAMGGMGSDAAIEAADVVIMTDEPGKLADAVLIARKTMGIAKQNIIFAIGIKVLVMVLTFFGYSNMWAAVFADVGVAVLAILNAVRALSYKK